MAKWQIVTNGRRYGLRNELGEFYRKPVGNVFGIVVWKDITFLCYEQALAKRKSLEAIERDDIWVPVDDK